MPLDTKLIDLGERHLVHVKKEIRAMGHVYVCEDVRRHVLIVSQTLGSVQDAIEATCRESVSLSSLSETATMRTRKGRAGSFCVRRLSMEDAVAYVEEKRPAYARVLIAARDPSSWTVCKVHEEVMTEREG